MSDLMGQVRLECRGEMGAGDVILGQLRPQAQVRPLGKHGSGGGRSGGGRAVREPVEGQPQPVRFVKRGLRPPTAIAKPSGAPVAVRRWAGEGCGRVLRLSSPGSEIDPSLLLYKEPQSLGLEGPWKPPAVHPVWRGQRSPGPRLTQASPSAAGSSYPGIWGQCWDLTGPRHPGCWVKDGGPMRFNMMTEDPTFFRPVLSR